MLSLTFRCYSLTSCASYHPSSGQTEAFVAENYSNFCAHILLIFGKRCLKSGRGDEKAINIYLWLLNLKFDVATYSISHKY
jgi:hypothetical protein